MTRTITTDDAIKIMVERIAVRFSPERIVLFGSQARGDARPDSDIEFKVADDDPEVDTAIYQSKDKGTMLVIVSNYGKSAKTAQVWLDFPKLINVPAPMEVRIVRDFETGVPNSFSIKDTDKSNEVFGRIGWFNSDKTIRIPNTLQVRVEPRDFRIIEFINAPAAQATGF